MMKAKIGILFLVMFLGLAIAASAQHAPSPTPTPARIVNPDVIQSTTPGRVGPVPTPPPMWGMITWLGNMEGVILNGNPVDNESMECIAEGYPVGTHLRIINPVNRKFVVVRVREADVNSINSALSIRRLKETSVPQSFVFPWEKNIDLILTKKAFESIGSFDNDPLRAEIWIENWPCGIPWGGLIDPSRLVK